MIQYLENKINGSKDVIEAYDEIIEEIKEECKSSKREKISEVDLLEKVLCILYDLRDGKLYDTDV